MRLARRNASMTMPPARRPSGRRLWRAWWRKRVWCLLRMRRKHSTKRYSKRLQIEAVRATDLRRHPLEASTMMAAVADHLLAQVAHLMCPRLKSVLAYQGPHPELVEG